MEELELQKIVLPLLEWYEISARDLPWRKTRDPYKIWISEIMLQQTRVEAVREYYRRFLLSFPDVFSLANAGEDEVLKAWEGLGYYSRARNLHRTAQIVARDFRGEFPKSPELLRKLPGIGEYTAGAIASIAFGLPEPAVDGNVLRVLSRVTKESAPVDDPKVKKRFSDALRICYPAGKCSEFTQSLMELGATVCLPSGKPLCDLCPVSDLCRAHHSGNETNYPVVSPKKGRTVQTLTVFALYFEDQLAIRRRPDTGLLAKMWELPNVEGHLSSKERETLLKSWGIYSAEFLGRKKADHIFTHKEWKMEAYFYRCKECPACLTWATLKELKETYTLPAAFQKLIKDKGVIK